MNNVSFGSLCVQKSTDFVTKKQRKVEEEVDKAFCQFSNDYFQKGDIVNVDDSGCNPWLISDLVERNVGADVYVKHKKDGNVGLSLRKALSEDNCDTDVITDENNKPITTVLDLTKPMRSIKKQIYNFAQKCELFANWGNEEKALKQDDYDATHPEEWAAKQEALAALEEEKAFVEEFQTDNYN